MTSETCWVVCDAGKVGTENQCVGLAESLGFRPIVKHVAPRFPWTYLPPSLWVCPLMGLAKGQDLSPPWPDLIIGAGRVSVAPTAAIRKKTQGSTKVVQLQNPRMSPHHFDAVIAPAHDRLTGPSVIVTEGALHRVTPSRLLQDAATFKHLVADLPRPLIAVLIGGTNACYQITPAVMRDLGNHLIQLTQRRNAGLAITFSRRTSEASRTALQETLGEHTPAVIWDGTGENPYFGFLGLADFMIVTCDSVSMASEACATGKPVFTYDLPGGSEKFQAFHRSFQEKGYTRPFGGTLETWSYTPPQDRNHVLSELKKLLHLS